MLMNRSVFMGALIAVTALAPLVASAQSHESTGVDIHAGIFFPFGSAARQNATGWLAYGANYRLLSLTNGHSTTHSSLSVSADYMGQSGWSHAPILLNYNMGSGSVFFSGGAGVGFATEPTGSGTDFAYQLSVGYNFPSTSDATFFVKAQYWGSDRTELDGAGVYAGVRF
jgi:hypothetical protein